MTTIHEWTLTVGLVWGLLLVVGFLAAAARHGSLGDRLLAIDSMGLCLTAVLALLAYRQEELGYLDAALALALLAFVGVLAAARYRRHGRSF